MFKTHITTHVPDSDIFIKILHVIMFYRWLHKRFQKFTNFNFFKISKIWVFFVLTKKQKLQNNTIIQSDNWSLSICFALNYSFSENYTFLTCWQPILKYWKNYLLSNVFLLWFIFYCNIREKKQLHSPAVTKCFNIWGKNISNK